MADGTARSLSGGGNGLKPSHNHGLHLFLGCLDAKMHRGKVCYDKSSLRANAKQSRKTVITRSDKRRSNPIHLIPHLEIKKILLYLSQNVTFSHLLFGRVASGRHGSYQCLINVDKRLRNKCAIVCDLFPRPFGERVRERGYLAASLLSRLAAFTLAEVLITLGIIGVVAAMTLPTLINNAQNKQLEVAFKKSYSALSQIAQRVALEDYGGQIPDDALGESLGYYAKYLNGKRCTGTAENGCPANADGDNYCNFMYKTYKDFSGKVGAPCIGNDYVVNVVSGSTFYFDYANEGEGIYGTQFVVIDVNGWQKRPNKLGHDMFLFSIGRDGKITAGGADTSFYPKRGYCNSSTTFSRNGYGCTINAINEKDYFKKLPR